jgi:hypothetical protein
MSLTEAKRELLKITGPAPRFPQTLLVNQRVQESDAALRAFVFDTSDTKELDRLQNSAMWRVLTNIPPKADPNEVLAMIQEGKQVNFGRVASAFQPQNDNDAAISALLVASGEDAMNEEDDDLYDDGMDISDDDKVMTTSRAGRRRMSTSSFVQPKSSSSASSMKPERQPSRWDGDLYKPFWTRGYGKQKEGWCGLCEPGVWLKTKTSVYW